MAVFQVQQKPADEAEVPQKMLSILGNSARGMQNIFSLPGLKGADFVMGKGGWNSQLTAAAGGSRERLLESLHEIICSPKDYDRAVCKAAAFFYGLNIDAMKFDFNREGVLQPSGRKFTINEIRFQQVLREIYGFEGMDNILAEQCSRAVRLMFEGGFFSVDKKKAGFTLNTNFPYQGVVSENKDVLSGTSVAPLGERQRFFLTNPQSPISLQIQNILVPNNLNIPSGQAYNFTNSYLSPYVDMIGGTLNQNTTEGKLAITIETPKLVSDFSSRMTQLADHYLGQSMQTTQGPKTVRELIEFGDPSSGGGTMLADGKTMADVETALRRGDVAGFLACLKKDSPLRQAFGLGDVTSKEYTLNMSLADIYAMQAKSYSVSLGGYVPVMRNADLFIYGQFTDRIFITNNTRTDIWSEPSETKSNISTTTGGMRLIGTVNGVDVSMKPRVIPKYILGASVSKTNVGAALKDMVKASDWEFMLEAGGGLGFKTKEFGNRVKKTLEVGADVLSNVSFGKGHAPNYNMQITPRVTFGMGKGDRARFTVYSDVLLLDMQKGVSMQKTLPYTRTGVAGSYEFMMPNSKFIKGIELNLDVSANPFKGIENVKVSDAFKNGLKDTNVQFGLIFRF